VSARSWRARLALLAAGTIVALALAEGALRIRDALLEADPRHFVADETLGWRPVPNVAFHYTTSIGTVEDRQNSHGMNEPERTFEKPPETFRILVIGDSFTQALEVRYEDRFTTKLETELRRQTGRTVEVINAGVQGYQFDQYVLYYENGGRRFRPDLVLVMAYIGNDVTGLLQTGTTEGGGIAQDKPRFHLENGRLVLDPILVPEGGLETGPWGRAAPRGQGALGTVKYWLYTTSALYRHLADSWYRLTRPEVELGPEHLERVIFRTSDTAATAEAWSIMEALVGRLRDDIAADGSRLLIAVQPEELASDIGEWQAFIHTYGLDPQAWDRGWPDRRLLAICGRWTVECRDLLGGLEQAGRAAYIPEDGHYSPLGHQVVADALLPWLRVVGLPGPR